MSLALLTPASLVPASLVPASLVPASLMVSCANKIPYEIIKNILDCASSLDKYAIWYPSIDIKTGEIRNRFNRDTCNRNIVRLHHMLRFKQQNPPRFHSITVGFYILDGLSYPCVEYILSRERNGYMYPVGDEYDETFSLSRRYIVITKDVGLGTDDYIYLDTQYEYRRGVIAVGSRRGFMIRDDDENYDYDSINEINVFEPKYTEPWNMSTHGRMTRKYDINTWNWEFSQDIVPGSDFDEFYEEPEMYDEVYASMSFKWRLDEIDFDGFGRFVRYDQLEMDTVQMIW